MKRLLFCSGTFYLLLILTSCGDDRNYNNRDRVDTLDVNNRPAPTGADRDYYDNRDSIGDTSWNNNMNNGVGNRNP